MAVKMREICENFLCRISIDKVKVMREKDKQEKWETPTNMAVP